MYSMYFMEGSEDPTGHFAGPVKFSPGEFLYDMPIRSVVSSITLCLIQDLSDTCVVHNAHASKGAGVLCECCFAIRILCASTVPVVANRCVSALSSYLALSLLTSEL